jgi:hypothetical protein
MLYTKSTRYALIYLIFDGKQGTEYTVRTDDREVIVEPAAGVNNTNLDYYWRPAKDRDYRSLIKAIMTRTVAYE